METATESPRSYCLNAGQRPPETCTDGGTHDWRYVSRPEGNWSGWHVERCQKCGIRQEYDTSD